MSTTEVRATRDEARPPEPGGALGLIRRGLNHPLADYGILLGATTILLIIGLMMVLSSSSVASYSAHGSSYTIFSRQLAFAVVGFLLMLFASRMPVNFFGRMAHPALIAAYIMLILVFVPGIGMTVNGQRNWIALPGGLSMQPSEFAKLALVVWAAAMIHKRYHRIDNWRSLTIPLIPATGAIVVLVLLEKDLGTCLVLMPILAGMLYVAGAPRMLFAWMAAGGLGVIVAMTVMTPYRMARLATWLDPQNDPTGTGWQIIRGQYALGTGGWWGVGLGASREKWGFLPEAQTDFISAVIGEELGLMGSLLVLALFATIVIVMVRISLRAESIFGRLVAAGVAIWVSVQSIVNIGTVIGAVPIMGVPLPLVSVGGSALVFTLSAIGIVLALARHEPAAREFLAERKASRTEAKQSRADRRHSDSLDGTTRRGRRGRRGRHSRPTQDVDIIDVKSSRSRRNYRARAAESPPS